MRKIHLTLWGGLLLLTGLWLGVDQQVFQVREFFPLRGLMVQYSGILVMACMSVAMILATRPRWLEGRFDGLDKLYRLHKWLGIASLSLGVIHWLWAKGPKWAVGWGWLQRPARGPRPVADTVLERTFDSLRGAAEGVGEWAFYAAVLLMVLALIKWFPYRQFFKTHRLLAVVYLAQVFHSVILLKYSYWLTPIGLIVALLMMYGAWAAVIVLRRRVAADRQVRGVIDALHYYPGVRVLATEIEIPSGWPGHKPGQFAFAMSDPDEGAHPYTIASAWDPDRRRIRFIIKELGDHTARLREKLRVGQPVTVEGPYGCFTFDDQCDRQIWVAGGIGITPFIARMQHLAANPQTSPHSIDLFHATSDYDPQAIDQLRLDAEAAGVRLHLLIGAQDGRLDGNRIRLTVPDWSRASFWFCGPAGFGVALRRDFAAHGLAVDKRFHQELFAMR